MSKPESAVGSPHTPMMQVFSFPMKNSLLAHEPIPAPILPPDPPLAANLFAQFAALRLTLEIR